jgi:hypothetical protein
VDCRDRPRKENAKDAGERCHKEGDPLSVLGDGGKEKNGSRKDGMGTATATVTGPELVRIGLGCISAWARLSFPVHWTVLSGSRA